MHIQIGGPPVEGPWVDLLIDMFRAGVEAAMPANCLPAHLPESPRGRTLVLGAGKAAHEMAAVVEARGDTSGMIAVPTGTPARTRTIAQIEATHPVPGPQSVAAAEQALAAVDGLGADDLVLCLISGGASSLWALPAPGLELDDKIAVTRDLLRSGAPIQEMNVVRKHLSRIKGGRLARAAAPARVVTLAISDVPGDDPASIGSGPTVGDASTGRDAIDILQRHEIEPAAAIRAALGDPANETPLPDDPIFGNTEFTIAATSDTCLEAAALVARDGGLNVHNLGGHLQGEARNMARAQAGLIAEILAGEGPVDRPCVILSGGESGVTVRGRGKGGRNTEYLLALFDALGAAEGVYALACDTDGIDGVSDAAGALMTPQTKLLAERRGCAAPEFLADNDSYSFFRRVGGLVTTGPTGTNVNDLRAIIVT